MVSPFAKVSVVAVTFLSGPSALPRLMFATLTTSVAAGGALTCGEVVGAVVEGAVGGDSFLQLARPEVNAATMSTTCNLVINISPLLYSVRLYFGGMLSFCPGNILSGSLRTPRFASKMRFQSLALP